ncbi:MAG: N-acetylmuramoyl-L-alanine amidase [Brumimicrobium sp.]
MSQSDSDLGLPHGIKTVVIDPGHGGKDPGAHGTFANEKNIVLDIGLRLGEYIKSKYPEINVIYTREKDVFVRLEDRAKIANDNHADLFISIHANAASPAAYGTETYVLGLHRTKSQEEIAKRENSTIFFEDGATASKDFELSPDAIIARQIQLSVFLNQSIDVASKVQAHFKALGRHDRGVKQAGFLVLYHATMPSMLIEIGFITNPEEEKFMNSEAGKIKLANAIFRGFQEYKAEIEGINILVEDGKGYEESLEEVRSIASTSIVNNEKKGAVYFKVQIETSRTELPLNSSRFKNINVQQYKDEGLFKYTTGAFENDFDSASRYKDQMKEIGFKYAFVVAFMDGKRISIDEGLKKIKN